jgi:hypothetical protein
MALISAIVLILATSRTFPELSKRMGQVKTDEIEKRFPIVLIILTTGTLVVLLLSWLVR